MTRLEKGICLFSASLVIGGLLGIPTAIVQNNGPFFLIFPFIFHLFLMLMAYQGHADRLSLAPSTAGLWVGVGVAFHLGKGTADFEGIFIAMFGWIGATLIFVILGKLVALVFRPEEK